MSSKNLWFYIRKLAPKIIGLFKVTNIVGTQVYKLALPPLYSRIYLVFYISLLKLVQLYNKDILDSINILELEDKDSKEE